MNPLERCIAYVDGFNLYFGLDAARLKRFLWLDVVSFAQSLCRSHQQLVAVKYFTSRISGAAPGDSGQQAAKRNAMRDRQKTYLNALAAKGGLEIIEGKFYANRETCQTCRVSWTAYEEKMTDVNIATSLLVDAYEDKFDTALVVSGDSDLSPPVEAVVRLFPKKKVVVYFPPQRASAQLMKVATNTLHVNHTHLKNQLPDPIDINGYPVRRPESWR